MRAGYGVFYDTVEYNEYIFPVLNAPFQKSAALTATLAKPIDFETLFPISAAPEPVAGTISSLTLAHDSRTPYVEQWNLDIEHELPGNAVAEIGYVGSQSTKLNFRSYPTQGILSNPGPNAAVTFSYYNFGSILMDRTGASANYNALITGIEKRFNGGYSFLAHYTYSKSMGTSSAVCCIGTEGSSPQNTWDFRADYGPLAYDVANNFVVSGIWELPFGRGKALIADLPTGIDHLVSGWEINGIYQMQSGFPFSISAVEAVSGFLLEPVRRAVRVLV